MPAFDAIGMDAVGANSSATVNLTAASSTETSTSSTGAATVTPGAARTVNLTVVGSNETSTSSTGAATVTPRNSGTMSYTPSSARTVKVQADNRAFSASGAFWDLANPKQPRGLKDPDSTIDISIDWSDWLADCQDTAASFSWTVNNGASNVGSDRTAGLATLFISGGNVGTTVSIDCRMTTNSSPPRIDERTVYLTIEDR